MRVNQDKQIEVFYNFSKDVQSSKDLLEGYRSDIDQLVANAQKALEEYMKLGRCSMKKMSLQILSS